MTVTAELASSPLQNLSKELYRSPTYDHYGPTPVLSAKSAENARRCEGLVGIASDTY
jgi:hypothetical protein